MHGRGQPIREAKKRWQKVGVGWQEEGKEIETARKVHFFKSLREFGYKRKMTDKAGTQREMRDQVRVCLFLIGCT